jgi:hypothetical protein
MSVLLGLPRGLYLSLLVSCEFPYQDSVKDGFCYLLHLKDYLHSLRQLWNWFSRNKMFRSLLCLQLWHYIFQLCPGLLPRRQLEQRRSKVWRRTEVRRLELVSQEWFDYSASIVVVSRGCEPPPDQQIGKANEGDESDAAHHAADNCFRMSWLGCWNRTRSGSERCTCRTCV